MKPVPLFCTYIIGFILFYKIMLSIGFEQKFFSLLFPDKNTSIQKENFIFTKLYIKKYFVNLLLYI